MFNSLFFVSVRVYI